MSLFAPDAVIIERTGEQTTGITNIREHLQHLVGLKPKMTIQSSQAHLNGDLALLCSRWTATFTAPDGSPGNLDFRGSEVARRQPDGTWQLTIDNPWGIDMPV